MQNTYAQKQKTAQKKDAPTAVAVLDESSQSEGLQRKADITLKQTIQCYGIEPGFLQHHTLLSAYPRSGDEHQDALNVSIRRFSTDTLTDFNSVLTNQSCIELQNCNKLLPPSVDYGEVTGVECITFNRYSPFGWKSWPNVWINNENLLRHIGSNNNVTRWKRIPYQTLIHTPAQWNNAIDMSIANSVQSTQQPIFNRDAPSFRPTQQPIFNRDAPSFQPTQQPIFNRDAPSFQPTQQKAVPSTASVLDDSTQTKALQRKADMASNAAQREEAPRPNNTGMPDNLKSGIESLSGFSMNDVRVHYNSSKPATVQALAYTQGTDIHVAPGQEKCLPHEAWHVAQQMAGRVSPTTNINGMPVNDNAALEHEADVMGAKAVAQRIENVENSNRKAACKNNQVSQMLRVINGYEFFNNDEWKKMSPKKKKDNRLVATQELRKKYINKAFRLLKKFESESDITKKEELRKRLEPYVPKNFMSLDFKTIKKKIKKRINTQTSTSADDAFLGENENLAIVAHGSTTLFADFDPKILADKVWNLLPKKYSGEIYLAGCQTGKQHYKDGTGKTSYIQEFYKELMLRDAIEPKKNIKPSIKGDRNYSAIFNNHVYVQGWEPAKSEGMYYYDYNDNKYHSDYQDGREYVRLYSGKIGKLHINQDGVVTDLRKPTLPPRPPKKPLLPPPPIPSSPSPLTPRRSAPPIPIKK